MENGTKQHKERGKTAGRRACGGCNEPRPRPFHLMGRNWRNDWLGGLGSHANLPVWDAHHVCSAHLPSANRKIFLRTMTRYISCRCKIPLTRARSFVICDLPTPVRVFRVIWARHHLASYFVFAALHPHVNVERLTASIVN